MFNRIISFITDFKLTLTLLALFAIACGVATFIENDFGTVTAKAIIYNAKWFELILFFLALSALGNTVKFKLYRISKLPILTFHLAFIIIILGAGITRYTGFQGTMHIREGDTSQLIVSDDTYLQFKVDDKVRQIAFDRKLFVNPLSNKNIDIKFKFLGEKVFVVADNFIYNARDSLIAKNNGKYYIELVSLGQQGAKTYYIEDGSARLINGIYIAFNNEEFDNAVQISMKDEAITFYSRFNGSVMSMMSQKTTVIKSHAEYPLQSGNLYMFNKVPIVYKGIHKNVELQKVSGDANNPSRENIIDVTVTHADNITKVRLIGGKGYVSPKTNFKSGNLNFTLSYGSKYYYTPFHIRLNDFRLKRYPGSDSPSAYESAVTLFDKRISDEGTDHLIHMNNVLDYDGFRFFQASYDQDELGTVLSINHDYWGTKITYLGYLLLFIGMFLTPFTNKSHFKGLGKKVKKIRIKRSTANILLFVLSLGLFANNAMAQSSAVIDEKHAEEFERILVQDYSGRIEPVQTLASEIVRKISGKEVYKGQNATQVFIGMMLNPLEWQNVPLIKVRHPELQEKLGINDSRATFLDFFDTDLNYILYNDVTNANRKKPAARDKYDKDVLAVDERLNICYAVFQGNMLKIFPLVDDPNNTWYTGNDHRLFNTVDSVFVQSALPYYFSIVNEARQSGDWTNADDMVKNISAFQQLNGADVVPSTAKVKSEILYNKLGIFKHLFGYYFLIGFVLLTIIFIDIFKSTNLSNLLIKILSYVVGILFIAHTIGLGMRWYIGGYAPWSNAYESMIYIGWATVLAGLLFSRTSPITIAATALLAALILMVAHLNWLNPEITPLVPVLKSYWLMIHVTCITASYGFLGLGALLGFINLVLMAVKRGAAKERINLVISELTHIAEMTLMIGLFMAAIGTFLGGVWANESWGRYWGWDPKETWALIIVLTYAIILHLRFINKSKYLFNLAAVLGFGSVIMTYFGVNYFLSGLHSYAAGDPVPIPSFVYYTLAVVGIVAVTAFLNKSNN